MIKVYFACSIRGGRDDQEIYSSLVQYLKDRCQVLSEIFADSKLTLHGSPGDVRDIWKKDLEWVKTADALVAEITNPSLGVGYEIAKAEEWGKPILGLFRYNGEHVLSAMIDGSPQTTVVKYKTLKEAQAAIDDFLKTLKVL